MPRIVFTPPLPLNAFSYSQFMLVIKRLSIDELKTIIETLKKQGYSIENYVRHESTVRVLNQVLGLDLQPSTALYQYQPGDVIVVVGLKKPVRGQEVEVKLEDLDIALVTVLTSIFIWIEPGSGVKVG